MAGTGRITVVTGGASGIGKCIALRLARDGASVAVFDVDLAGAEDTSRQITAGGGKSVAVQVDVSDSAAVAAGMTRVHEAFGPVAILVNNAGTGELVPVAQMSEMQWDRMLAVHLKGMFLCARAAMGDMVQAGWGRIVNMASVAGMTGSQGFAHYSAAKGGIIAFTKSLAQELGPMGITVNAIAPGLIETPAIRRCGLPQSVIDGNIRTQAVKRLGQPEDIAAACAFLVSEEAGFVTGQVLSPNGGVHM